MGRALELAARGRYTTDPNPRVGCVLVRDGEVVGEGWHVRAGGPHAEIIALREAGERWRQADAAACVQTADSAARAWAAMQSRDFVLPDDVKLLAEPTLAHRLIISPSARIKEADARAIIREVLDSTPVPGAGVSRRGRR